MYARNGRKAAENPKKRTAEPEDAAISPSIASPGGAGRSEES
jgi:hypothetical protein